MGKIVVFLFSVIMVFSSCSIEENVNPSSFWGPSPWPEIRKKRIKVLLPEAMVAAKVDAWITICRENNNDPMADHIGGENAGGTAVFLFYLEKGKVSSIVFSPIGEATALDELDIHDEVRPVPRGLSAIEVAADYIKQQEYEAIAINSSTQDEQADGLSYSQRIALEKALGTSISKRLVSSDELVYQWLSIKLPEEVEIMTRAAELTAQWEIEAYQQIIPGITTDAEVAQFLKQKMEEYGVTDAWAPDQNPNVNSGPDRGHSHSTDKIIMQGDVIQTDFGIKVYHRWVTDIQRFAYVLRDGESDAPKEIKTYWESGREGGFAAFSAMKPGVRGIDVDRAQRERMKANNSDDVMWSTGHPVGYVAHDVGPNLGGSQSENPRAASLRPLKEGMVFAFDGFHAWTREDGTQKTISVEEMAVITKEGARYLIPRQMELVIVGKK